MAAHNFVAHTGEKETLELNKNKTEIMKLNHSNRLIENTKKFEISTYRLLENE